MEKAALRMSWKSWSYLSDCIFFQIDIFRHYLFRPFSIYPQKFKWNVFTVGSCVPLTVSNIWLKSKLKRLFRNIKDQRAILKYLKLSETHETKITGKGIVSHCPTVPNQRALLCNNSLMFPIIIKKVCNCETKLFGRHYI